MLYTILGSGFSAAMGASPIVPKPLITGLTSVWPWSIPINETQHKNVKKGIFIVVFFAYI
jgi:hypothetical protein